MTDMRAKLVVEADASSVPAEAQRTSGSLETISRAADKTAASFSKVETQSKSAEAMQRRLNATFNNFGVGSKSARESAEAIQKAYELQRAYQMLEESIDPLIRAEREYAAAQKLVNNAVSSGAASKVSAARTMTTLKARYDQVAAAQGGVTKSASAMTGGVRNASYQVADIAVQLQMGTAASMVFAQQMPQLLAGFGVMGAVMGAVVAVGGPLISMLFSAGDASEDLEQKLGRLETQTQAVADHLAILRDQNLSATFGAMAGDVRELTRSLLALDRAAELKTLHQTLSALLNQNVNPGFWQRGGMSLVAPGATREELEAIERDFQRKNYESFTEGRGPSFDRFDEMRRKLTEAAKSGDVEEVTRQTREMIAAFAHGQPVTDLNKKLLEMLQTLGQIARKTAEVEAQFNGSALFSGVVDDLAVGARRYWDGVVRRVKVAGDGIDALNRSMADHTALAQEELAHGKDSAQYQAERNRQAAEALKLRLRQIGVAKGSLAEEKALADLAKQQRAEAALRERDRADARAVIIGDLVNELAITDAIAAGGADSAEVERLRVEQAKAALRAKLQALRASEQEIEYAERLLEQERERARAAKARAAEATAATMLDRLRREAELQRAIILHGKNSLEVKRLQIEAARAEYEERLKTLKVNETTKAQLLEYWDAAKGLKSVDPFGSLSAARAILEAQAKGIAKLQLEQALLGQSERTRRRVLALYEAELEIRQKGIDANGALAQKIRKGALEQANLAAEVAAQADAWKKVEDAGASAIDKIVDAALEADIPGVFEGIAEEVSKIVTDLAIKNPLKNALLGTDLATLQDAGGLAGIWDRLTGRAPAPDMAALAARAAAQSVATMRVNAATVIIGGSGVAGAMGAAANDNIAAFAGGKGAGLTGDWLSYSNGGAIRSQPISNQLKNAMSFLEQMGIRMDVFSGGQDATGPRRVGSHRHDFGNAADVMFWQGDRRLDWRNPGDVPIFQEIVARARANGVTGFGAGPGYMQPGSMHIGYGTPAVWGAGGQGANAPAWLVEAFNKPASSLTKLATASELSTRSLGTMGQGFDLFGQALGQIDLGQMTGGSGGGFFQALLGPLLGGLGIPGFEVGGPTGGSNPSRVAGVVHEQEYVFDAASTRRIGVQNLEALRRGRMPGYARGGYVSHVEAYPALQAAQANDGGRPMIQIVNQTSVPMTGEIEETTDARGQRQYRLVVAEMAGTGLATPGGKAQRVLKQNFGVRRSGVNRL